MVMSLRPYLGLTQANSNISSDFGSCLISPPPDYFASSFFKHFSVSSKLCKMELCSFFRASSPWIPCFCLGNHFILVSFSNLSSFMYTIVDMLECHILEWRKRKSWTSHYRLHLCYTFSKRTHVEDFYIDILTGEN